MRSFRCLFDITESSFSIADPIKDEIGNLEINLKKVDGLNMITLIDRKDTEEGVPIHRGLKAIVDISADSMDKAINMARQRVDGILTMLTVVTNATVGEAQLQLGYETSNNATSTEYIQVEYLCSDHFKRKRVFDNDKFKNLVEKILKNSNKRISRAIRWYRKGLIETDPLDRFMSYWLGLENLDKTLGEMLGENIEKRNCVSCGEPYEVPSAKGVRSLFEKHSINGVKDFKRCRNLRVDLQHGAGDLETAMFQVSECSELCRIILLKGIYLALSLDVKEVQEGPEPIYNIHQPRIEFRGQYKIPPKDLPTIPLILIKNENIKATIVDGKRVFSFVDNIDSNINADMTIQMTFVTEKGVEANLENVKTVPKK
ncbi:MAG: hypothetical protein GX154_08515 [Clostridiales bacterium]|nr:hypothetical protein [Clostridiales bacterium]